METLRTEHDFLGERQVPADALWGIHTLRAVENFPLSGLRLHPELIRALGLVKRAAAEANQAAGLLDAGRGEAIARAAQEVADSLWDDAFRVDPLQGGAGTSANMNANEVVANRAAVLLGGKPGDHDLVHPNDHVNLSQSTNDVVPTAVRIAAITLLKRLTVACSELQGALQDKEAEFAGIYKVGRTEMQDAVPMTLGQSFSAFAQAIGRDRWRLYKVEERLRQVPMGGTAVGTGLNTDRRYLSEVIERLRTLTGQGLARAENPIDLTQNADVFAEVSGLLKAAAVNLAKIASDLILLSSGPRAGIGEIRLPAVQAGSSIMPGKVNPVIPEAVTQIAYQVMACDLAITLGAQAGRLELNATMPMVAHNLFMQLDLLTNGMTMFTSRCIRGITADAERCSELLEASLATATGLVPLLGYELASSIAREAQLSGRSLREVLAERDVLTSEQVAIALDPANLTRPGLPRLKTNERQP